MLTDITGGIAEEVDMTQLPRDTDHHNRVWSKIRDVLKDNGMVFAYLKSPQSGIPPPSPVGLQPGALYPVIQSLQLKRDGTSRIWDLLPCGPDDAYNLLKMYWGKAEPQWSGPWAPGSAEWAAVRPEARAAHGLPETQENGYFVIGMPDFITAFTHLVFLHVPPTSVLQLSSYMWS